jgi:pyridoxal phosphate enzyme (YggS family)
LSENNIAQNIQRIKEEIHTLALFHHRNPDDITLIGVSKFFPALAAKEAVQAGLADLGENRVQELIEKREILSALHLNPNWHLIGTLQRRKVKQIVGKASLIHSVDSLELLSEIARCSAESGIISPILLELNISREETKHGFDLVELEQVIETIAGYKEVDLQGIMTMAPLTQDQAVLHAVFSEAQETFGKMKSKIRKDSFRILSMGMSNDYPVAIQHGATHLRIGTAIFGVRDHTV